MRYIKYFWNRYRMLLKENERYVYYAMLLIFIVSVGYQQRIREVYYPGMPFSAADGLIASESYFVRIFLEVPMLFLMLSKISEDTYHSTSVLVLRDFQKVWFGQVVKCTVNAVFMAVLFLAVEILVNLKQFPNVVNFTDETSIFANNYGILSEAVGVGEVVWKYLVIKSMTLLVFSLIFSNLNILMKRKMALLITFGIHVLESYFYRGVLAKNDFAFTYKMFMTNIFPNIRLCVLIIAALILTGYLLIPKKDVLR